MKWTRALEADVERDLASLEKAKDLATFCPSYPKAKRDRIKVWAALFEWAAYYESSWNPTASSVDVGSAADRDTWSVGLLQLSVVDQQNYGIPLGYGFEDLKRAEPNLDLGVRIMAKQIEKRGKIAIPKSEPGDPGVYWATLNPGNKYDKTSEISAKTKALEECKAR